ncbi:hypothetical protein GGX14DRAFT_612299 [Mycena pura]|uniref:INO80 complex subunit F domain-containing protein n=1 Tax=Mycena pura TaxID=153505 RepID=A0AAD7E4E4_9AGAR|nr:hypothetical protein GGX14DRAFT_612299 [Mycena pura]
MAAMNTPPPQQQPPPGPFPNLPPRQSTQPPFSVGIAAGAEDVKYQAKYKDLKRKVKEVESDNDKLHFKILQAKRSIQRMKLERAVLYERLQQVPQSTDLPDRLTLATQRSPGMPHQPQQHHSIPPNHMPSAREVDRTPPDYARTHLRPEGRSGPVDSSMPPGGHPHDRRGSLGGPEPRPVQFMHHLGPPPAAHGHPPLHTSPRAHHERDRAQDRSPGRPGPHPPSVFHALTGPSPPQQQQQQPYSDVVQHSPTNSHARRLGPDIHELAARHQNSLPPLSPSSDARGGRGAPNHQRLGPGAYINEADRDWERDRGRTHDAHMRSPPPPMHRSRPVADRADYPDAHARRRDESSAAYYGERPPFSRSNSAGSGSGSVAGDGVPSRPDSRAQLYEGERGGGAGRSFRLRPVTLAEEADHGHEDRDGRTRQRHGSGTGNGGGGGGGGGYVGTEQGRPPPLDRDSRKRSRTEMDDTDEGHGPPGMYSRHSETEPRGSKRYHQASDRM